MYKVYLDKILLPQTPEKIEMAINNKNETFELISIGEVNARKKAGLTDIEFEVVLPNVEYPWAQYLDGFEPASYFLERLEEFKTGNNDVSTVFPFVVTREYVDEKSYFSTSMDVTLEEYSIVDSVDEGVDITVSIKLKQYKKYNAIKIVKKSSSHSPGSTTKKKNTRTSTKSTSSSTTYTVKRGDSLSSIAKKKLGKATRWREIYNLNKKLIKHPNRLSIGWKLKLPKK